MTRAKAFFSDVIPALSTSTLYILGSYSFASLIFTGSLSSYLSYGFNLILISNIVGCLFGSRFSSFPILASLTQTSNLTIFALISAALVSNITANSSSIDPIYTVYAAMIFLGVVVGFILWVMGKFQTGNIARFIPFPVVVAFLAASGWILVEFSIELIMGKQLSLFSLDFSNNQALVQLMLSFFIVIIILILQKWFTRSFIEPIVYVMSIILFYCILLITKIPIEQLKTTGWYIEIVKYNGFSNPIQMLSFSKIEWGAFLDWNIAGNIIAILIITPLFLLLTLNGIEKETQHEFNYDKELKYTGISNIILSLVGGGAIVSAALSGTLRNFQLGARSRWVGVLIAVFFSIALVFGAFLLQSIPLFIVASLPLMTGVNLIRNWLFYTKNKLSKLDYILLWFVFLVIAFKGFLMGIFLGLVAALSLFNYRYSQVAMIRNTVTGLELQSNNERGMAAEALLKNLRSQMEIIILQGYLFFGNINILIEKLITRIEDPKKTKLYFIVLDFRNVQGMDPSSTESFFRLYKHIKEREIKVIFTHLSPRLSHNILTVLNLPSSNNFFLNFPTLDYGLEWCEDYFLKKKTLNWKTYFAGQLHLIFPEESELKSFMDYLELFKVPAGTMLFSEAQILNQIYFLETGVLDMIYTDRENNKTRVKTIFPGVFIGEASLYLGEEQVFSCIAKAASSLYSLSFDNLIKMETENPKLALTLHRFIISQTLNRLTHTNRTILSLI